MKQMKQTLAISCLLLLFVGCNENKEARIRKLEQQSELTSAKLEKLENRIESMESAAAAKEH